MKRRDYIIGISSFFLLCLSAGLLIYSGLLRDANMDIDMPSWMDLGIWALLVINFILFVGSVVYLAAKISSKREYRRFSGIIFVSVLICLVGNGIFSCSYYSFASEYKISRGADYIDNEWLEGICLQDMKELMADARDDVIVYIGREDCRDCKKFEEEFLKILEKHSVITPTYFTDQDREGENREELDKFLALYGIESVPCVFFVSGGKVVQKWDNPIDSISEIESYL